MKRSILRFLVVPLVAVFVAAFSIAADKSASPSIGQAAPGFSLPNQDGKPVNLSDYSGKIVVLEWFNDGCPFVQRHYRLGTMKNLADKYKDKGVVWLAINTTKGATAAHDKQFVEEHQLPYPILGDTESAVARSYGAKTTPHMFVIDKNGALAYEGGIDNQATDEGPVKPDTINYVDKALTELTSGQSVSVPQSQPYGCGVHYKN